MVNRPRLEWSDGKLRYLDQSRLPHESVLIETDDHRVVARSIRTLGIRGAPAIGVAAAYAVVLAARACGAGPEQARHCRDAITHLSETRPTAVNLFVSLERMREQLEAGASAGDADLSRRLEAIAVAIHREDQDACARIAALGAPLIPPGSSVLTHCHTGALATGGGGTALNVILEAFRRGSVRTVYVDETRPLLQGARLTAWELVQEGVDTVLITDSTAGHLLKLGRVDSVWVGADRIAANGDVANKIGTYTLAVLAARHNVPLYVAAPVSTVDLLTVSGDGITLEERGSDEVTSFGGVQVAPDGVRAYVPAFDVTPHTLVTALVTDAGVVRPPFGETLRDLIGQRPRAEVNR